MACLPAQWARLFIATTEALWQNWRHE